MNSDERVDDELLAAHERYLTANSLIDPELLAQVWDPDQSNVWFNLSGHAYQGLAHWTKLWEYYRSRIETVVPWSADSLDVRHAGPVGWVTCSRSAELAWKGPEQQPLRMGPSRSRSTMIFLRRDGDWRAVHAHFSPESDVPRPGGI